jgi:carbonic anhydrase
MAVTDDLLANNVEYAKTFQGPLTLPPAKHLAVVACMDILIHHTDCGMLTFTDDDFKRSIQDETGIKPESAAEAFADLNQDVRQSIARIKASQFIPKTVSVRGFVFDVATGTLNEVDNVQEAAA